MILLLEAKQLALWLQRYSVLKLAICPQEFVAVPINTMPRSCLEAANTEGPWLQLTHRAHVRELPRGGPLEQQAGQDEQSSRKKQVRKWGGQCRAKSKLRIVVRRLDGASATQSNMAATAQNLLQMWEHTACGSVSWRAQQAKAFGPTP